MSTPVLDRFGRVINGQQQISDPITQVLYPCYFSLIPAIAQSERGESPQEIADEAMSIALAACAKIGIFIHAKPKEETCEQPSANSP